MDAFIDFDARLRARGIKIDAPLRPSPSSRETNWEHARSEPFWGEIAMLRNCIAELEVSPLYIVHTI